MVVNKPARMLSAPGRTLEFSVYSLMKVKYPEATGQLYTENSRVRPGADSIPAGLFTTTKCSSTYSTSSSPAADAGTASIGLGTTSIPHIELTPHYKRIIHLIFW